MVEPSLYTTTTKLHHLKKPPPPCSAASTVKFLCSYGGRIIPRHPDGKLRYHGGDTRVLSVDRSISFSELVGKLGELCGAHVSVRFQLPHDDLDALVTVTSDEDLANLVEEYDRAAAAGGGGGGSMKIRAFLSVPKRLASPFSSSSSSSSSSSPTSLSSLPYNHGGVARVGSSSVVAPPVNRCYHQMAKPVVAYPPMKKVSPPPPHPNAHHQYGYPSHYYLVRNENHWQ